LRHDDSQEFALAKLLDPNPSVEISGRWSKNDVRTGGLIKGKCRSRGTRRGEARTVRSDSTKVKFRDD